MLALIEQPVLVLNVNYEPLNVCSTKRAMGLMLAGKAEVIVNGRGLIRTSSTAIPAPSVLRLSYMVHRPRPRVKLSKREIFRRDRYTCQYCGRKGHPLTIDHVWPRNRGGGYTWQNLVSACPACNRRKGNRAPEEAGMPLRSRPKEPTASAEYLYARMLEHHRDWEQFISGW